MHFCIHNCDARIKGIIIHSVSCLHITNAVVPQATAKLHDNAKLSENHAITE